MLKAELATLVKVLKVPSGRYTHLVNSAKFAFLQVAPVGAGRPGEPARPHAEQQLPSVVALWAGETIPASGEKKTSCRTWLFPNTKMVDLFRTPNQRRPKKPAPQLFGANLGHFFLLLMPTEHTIWCQTWTEVCVRGADSYWASILQPTLVGWAPRTNKQNKKLGRSFWRTKKMGNLK